MTDKQENTRLLTDEEKLKVADKNQVFYSVNIDTSRLLDFSFEDDYKHEVEVYLTAQDAKSYPMGHAEGYSEGHKDGVKAGLRWEIGRIIYHIAYDFPQYANQHIPLRESTLKTADAILALFQPEKRNEDISDKPPKPPPATPKIGVKGW